MFSLECFCLWRNEVLSLSCSLPLSCVFLVIFDPLYICIAVVCEDDLSWGFVGTSRWNISMITCNCKDWVQAQLVSSIPCSQCTYIPTLQAKNQSYFQKSLWACLLKLCQCSLNLHFWLGMPFWHPALYKYLCSIAVIALHNGLYKGIPYTFPNSTAPWTGEENECSLILGVFVANHYIIVTALVAQPSHPRWVVLMTGF